ncbi:hypothetical protein A3I40_00665 [Candidatus Uhrbacteria bacterium RIFCSPLOWO2_02_FULL_48_12]|uniref:acylphosphatase n=1 Tax=Candidatus Uhrbacteria bacterium RIFCSPLOWO2_02_FULL_48_12 TaxID=1802407 RepID=A0A1F7V707_9BACT|nr:MAG: hypothetical protein A3I40_00665 [Candidatus Uhrbacteria bacterium RIFCSPLOWO2_02_FULL_48_12]
MAQGHLKIARHIILVTGRVKRVGFRHHVLKLARQYRLGGFAANCPEGVHIEIEGSHDTLQMFTNSLRLNPPFFAKIADIKVTDTALLGEKEFIVLPDLVTALK